MKRVPWRLSLILVGSLLAGCGGGGASPDGGGDEQPPASGEGPLIADAGPDRCAVVGSVIHVRGYDPSGSVVGWQWSEAGRILGRSETFDYHAASKGMHRILLTVSDDSGQKKSDSMTIRVADECGRTAPGDRDGDFIPDTVEGVLGLDASDPDQNRNGLLDGNETEGGYGDPFFFMQWHLQNLGIPNNDSGIAPVLGQDLGLMEVYHRYMGYNDGDPIVLQVVDTGVETGHEDLRENIAWNCSYDGMEPGDPIPRSNDPHGTKMAGVLAADAFNGKGVRGVAPFAKIAGSNWLLDPTPEALEYVWYSGADADRIAVSSNSWGSYFDTDTVAEEIMALGSANLRGGKGRIYVFAAGNDRGSYGEGKGDTNLQYPLSNRFAIAVSALGSDGLYAPYSTPGANLFVCAYGGENYQDGPSIGTTTLEGTSKNEGTHRSKTTWWADWAGNYTYALEGTSAACPMAAGGIGLILEACPRLGWRDLRWLLGHTADKVDPQNGTWIDNAAGLHFSRDYGLGRIDVKRAIDECTAHPGRVLPAEENTTIRKVFDAPIPDEKSGSFTLGVSRDLTVEWVELLIDNDSDWASDYRVTLRSPAGTSVLMMRDGTHASRDYQSDWMRGGFRLGTPAFMGEKSAGEWTVRVEDRQAGHEGTLHSVTLKIYGHVE